MFGVLLGTVSPLGIDFNIQCFLGIQVGNDPELEPRMQLTSAVYSLNSDRVQGYGVSASPNPETLLPLDATGKFPASVLPASSGTSGDYLRKNSPDTSRGTSSSPMLLVSNVGELSGDGINGRSIAGIGISGRSEKNDGVVGWTDAGDRSGVFGFSAEGKGVLGRSDKNDGVVGWTGESVKSGVFGHSPNGSGVTGRSDTNDGTVGWTGAGDKSGVRGTSTDGRGVVGHSDKNDGVVGWTGTSQKSGIFGHSTSGFGVTGRSDNDYGIFGWTGAYDKSGVFGESVSGDGVTGRSNIGNGVAGYGMFGVYGTSDRESGNGVAGYTTGKDSYGVSGSAVGEGSTGVVGISIGQDGTGVFGEGNIGTGIEGYSHFGTAIHARGSFTASGTKSAEAKLDDGTIIRLFSEEATEVYFADYGDGTLHNGRAHIELDLRFLQTVTIDAAHPLRAFIQLEGDCNGVYVTNKTNTGFDVIELKGGESSAPFTYRVVCKRRYFEDQRMPTPKIDNQQTGRMLRQVWPEVIEKSQARLRTKNLNDH
jgi:hypothetical protein